MRATRYLVKFGLTMPSPLPWTLHHRGQVNEVRLIHGDCLEVLPTLPAHSIDSIVTDPPYGLQFMGEHWDRGVPGEAFWEAMLRVAKPGAYLLAFGGTRTYHRLTCAIEDAGWKIRDCLMWLYGTGFPKGKACLKPGWEPIVLAKAPGKLRPLNVDACRIATTDKREYPNGPGGKSRHYSSDKRGAEVPPNPWSMPVAGRWPANVALDESAGVLLDQQSGNRKAGVAKEPQGKVMSRSIYGETMTLGRECGYGDTGGASRFFYCAKASRRERGEGNTHPTVKPLALMQWLVRLVTPPGGRCLDPFLGSGSTGVACDLESVQFIGIDLDASYVAIAEKRLTVHELFSA